MKLVESMKDEQLGVAILYNFTKGYGNHVAIELYNCVLPLIYNDLFRETVLKYETIEEVIHTCLIKNPLFIEEIKQAIEDNKQLTDNTLGISLISQVLRYEATKNGVEGNALDAPILDMNEAIKLGKMMKNKTIDEILNLEKPKQMKIAILQSHTIGRDISWVKLNVLGDVHLYENVEDKDILETIGDSEILITNKNQITREILEKSNLKMVGVMATGYNNIDIEAAKELGITVCNVANYSTPSVAQETFALLLELMNHTNKYDQYVKEKHYSESGSFSFFEYPVEELNGKTWGIIGLGNIGRQVAKIASAFNAKVQYTSLSNTKREEDYPQVNLRKLLETSDIISIHAPYTEEFHHLINKNTLSYMKKDAYLINVARGPFINEEDLAYALKLNQIKAAALDVFEVEPLRSDSPLFTVNPEKIIFAPHVGWGSTASRNRLRDEVYLNIEAFINGKERNKVV